MPSNDPARDAGTAYISSLKMVLLLPAWLVQKLFKGANLARQSLCFAHIRSIVDAAACLLLGVCTGDCRGHPVLLLRSVINPTANPQAEARCDMAFSEVAPADFETTRFCT